MFQVIGHPDVERLYIFNDDTTLLRGYIALHCTTSGPAIGGTRCLTYPSDKDALFDAIRLSKAMSYKAALAGLPFGGGKAVLIAPPRIPDREAYFRQFGEYVEQLGGRFITSLDSGTTPKDLEYIAQATRYVSRTQTSRSDPSPYTARGLMAGIRALLEFKLQRDQLNGLNIAIQGLGQVGSELAKLLRAEGARLTLTDINYHRAQSIAQVLGARAVPPDEIYDTPCEIFCPCALGEVLSQYTIPRLQCLAVIGCANNQLATPHDAYLMHRKNIVYIPDFAVNAGGLLQVSMSREHASENSILERIDQIGHTVTQLLIQSEARATPPQTIASELAQQRLYGHGEIPHASGH